MGEAGFDNATFYDASGEPIGLSWTTPEEAIAESLDWMEGIDLAKWLSEFAPIKVTAWVRDEVDPHFISGLCDTFAEWLEEHFADEYGDPDGADDWSVDVRHQIAEALAPAIEQSLAKHATVWRCTQCGERPYDREAVLKILRESRPALFEGSHG